MNKLLLATGVALCALTGSAFAADLIIDEPAIAAATPDVSIYLQFLGGAALPGPYEYNGLVTYDLEAGGALAGVIGVGTGLEGLSVEADFFITQRGFVSGINDYTLTTGTAMAALKYTVSLNDSFDLYGAVGLGGVYLHDEADATGVVFLDAWGAGYLVKAGVTVAVAEQISLVGEVRYANSFSAIEDSDLGNDGHAGTAAVLVGVQIGF